MFFESGDFDILSFFFFSSFLRNDYKEFLYSYLMENMKRTKYVILHYKRQMRKSFNVENEVT